MVVLDMTSQSGGGEEENYNNLSARQHHGISQYLQLREMTSAGQSWLPERGREDH